MQSDTTAPSRPNVLAQISADTTDYHFPILIADEGSFGDLDLSVKFKAVSGKVDHAGGLTFHLTDANNYYVVQANALENNYNLYKVVAGNRREITGTSVTVTSGQWHEITCYFDGAKKINTNDSTFESPGKRLDHLGEHLPLTSAELADLGRLWTVWGAGSVTPPFARGCAVLRCLDRP